MNAQEAIARVLSTWESGQFPAHAALSMIALNGPARSWSLVNRTLMYAQGATDARGFQQWKDVGRSVKKGERALHILAPHVVKCHDGRTNQDDHDPSDERPLILFRMIPVFDILQTEGAPLLEYQPIEPPPLLEVAQAWGIPVEWVPTNLKAFGRYSPQAHHIAMYSHNPDVFFHELTHAAEHRLYGVLVQGQDPDQEIVAEATAAILAELYGVPTDGAYTRAYVARYGECEPEQAASVVMRLLPRIEVALAEIISAAGNHDFLLTAEQREERRAELTRQQAIRHAEYAAKQKPSRRKKAR